MDSQCYMDLTGHCQGMLMTQSICKRPLHCYVDLNLPFSLPTTLWSVDPCPNIAMLWLLSKHWLMQPLNKEGPTTLWPKHQHLRVTGQWVKILICHSLQPSVAKSCCPNQVKQSRRQHRVSKENGLYASPGTLVALTRKLGGDQWSELCLFLTCSSGKLNWLQEQPKHNTVKESVTHPLILGSGIWICPGRVWFVGPI